MVWTARATLRVNLLDDFQFPAGLASIQKTCRLVGSLGLDNSNGEFSMSSKQTLGDRQVNDSCRTTETCAFDIIAAKRPAPPGPSWITRTTVVLQPQLVRRSAPFRAQIGPEMTNWPFS
jgi:hypothetical protein